MKRSITLALLIIPLITMVMFTIKKDIDQILIYISIYVVYILVSAGLLFKPELRKEAVIMLVALFLILLAGGMVSFLQLLLI